MKTTIELSDVLFDQAKAAARVQGVTLKALIESGLRMAIHPRIPVPNQLIWPDLTSTSWRGWPFGRAWSVA